MLYTNRSAITKTFHGVTFRPGDTKEVFGIINDSTFVHSSTRQEPPKCDRSASSKSEQSSEKVVVSKRGRRKATSTPSVETSDAEVNNEDLDNFDNIDNKEV